MIKSRFGLFETNSSSSHSLSIYREYKAEKFSFNEVIEKYKKAGKLDGNKLNIRFYDYSIYDRIVNYETLDEKLDAIHTYIVQRFMNKLGNIFKGDEEYEAMDDEDKQAISERGFWEDQVKTINFINKVKKKDYNFLFDEEILEYFRNLLIYIEDNYGSVEFNLIGEYSTLGVFEYDHENFFVKASIDDIYTIIVDDSVFIQVQNTYL